MHLAVEALIRLRTERKNLSDQLDAVTRHVAALTGALQFCDYMIGVMSAPEADASPKEPPSDPAPADPAPE